jgi:serine protease Do
MGNSGGPLLNVDGELIGINVAILSPSGTSAGIGFAIPANTARIVADQLISKGKVTHSNLGIVPQDIPAFLRTRLGAEHGAYVNQVREGTPAFRAGLQAGDVITRFGTTEIVGEVGLRNAISLATPNVVVPITIVRAGKAHALSATLVPRESVETGAAAAPVATAAIPHRRAVEFGILLRPLTPTLATDLHLPAGTKGVFVGNVVQGSSAADAGLERDCVVTAVNGVAVADADGVNHLLSQTKPGDIVTLTLYLPAIDEISAGHGVVDILVP